MNVFKLMATLGLDASAYNEGLDNAEHGAESFGSKLKSGLTTVAKVSATALAATATGLTKLTSSAINNYASYEQLVGGVETLFDKSADKVQEYAALAYKTAGLSANEYMETVTSFSASLLQSLSGDTEAAAEYADMAIRDMSDNANKMGSSMESIQNAYQGFAKQNYTMLDNLKLGYGGTASEMARLITDAEALNSSFVAQRDEHGNLVMSYSDVVDAIHIVQTEMGITGTTAKEAAGTISGSVSSMKAAWQNLVTGIADENANMSVLAGDFMNSLVTAVDNIVPRIGIALEGISDAVSDVIPDLMDKMIDLVEKNAPALVEAATKLLTGVIQTIVKNASKLAKTITDVIKTILKLLSENVPAILAAVSDGLLAIVDIVLSSLPDLLEAVLEIIEGLAQGIIMALPVLLDALPQIIMGIVNFVLGAIPQILDAVMAIIDGIVQATPQIVLMIVEMIPTIIENLVLSLLEHIPDIIEAGTKLIGSLFSGDITANGSIIAAIPRLIIGLVKMLTDPKMIQKLLEAGWTLLEGLLNGLVDIGTKVWEACQTVINAIVTYFKRAWSDIKDVGTNVVRGIWEGIKGGADWIWNKVKEWFGGLFNKIKDFLGIASPSKLSRDVIGKNLVLGLAEGIDDNADTAVGSMLDLADELVQAADIGDVTYRAAIEGSRTMGSGDARRWNIVQNVYAYEMSPVEAFEAAQQAAQTAEYLGLA